MDVVIDCNLEAEFAEPGLSIGHIFGLYSSYLQPVSVPDWSLF